MILKNNEVHLTKKSLTGIANMWFKKNREKALIAVIKCYRDKKVHLDGVVLS